MTQVTYIAPEGDNEVVTTGGVKFFNGQPLDLGDEHARLVGKLRNNPHFRVDGEAAAVDEPGGDPHETGLSAVHNGGGRWIIVRDGDKAHKVKEGLTKADAAAFNALSPEDREAY